MTGDGPTPPPASWLRALQGRDLRQSVRFPLRNVRELERALWLGGRPIHLHALANWPDLYVAYTRDLPRTALGGL